jgi:5-oxoprolinase (ATP-hydrolysing) subunit C
MIVIRKVLGLATVQDGGRVGYASQGLPASGALVRTLAHAANAAVGNDPDAACIEIFGRFACVAERAIDVATERGDWRSLRPGEELVVEPDPSVRVRYLALAGGVAAPFVLGSASTFAACGIGRALRTGDRIGASSYAVRDRVPAPALEAGPVRVIAGPDEHAALEDLLAAKWRISTTSDRVGTRLEGPSLATAAGGTLPSSPTVVGAIQLPHGGAPIVIGPDGPTTGGYPILAVIARGDRDRFHALPLGAHVTFTCGEVS